MTDTPVAVAPFSHRTHPNARNCAKEFRPSSRRRVHPLTPTHSVIGHRSSVVGRRSSVVGRRSSVVGSRQSAVGSRQSGLPACFGIGTHLPRQRIPHATTIDCGKSMGTGIVASTRRPMAAIPAAADCQRTGRHKRTSPCGRIRMSSHGVHVILETGGGSPHASTTVMAGQDHRPCPRSPARIAPGRGINDLRLPATRRNHPGPAVR